jgi:hypothetical protein
MHLNVQELHSTKPSAKDSLKAEQNTWNTSLKELERIIMADLRDFQFLSRSIPGHSSFTQGLSSDSMCQFCRPWSHWEILTSVWQKKYQQQSFTEFLWLHLAQVYVLKTVSNCHNNKVTKQKTKGQSSKNPCFFQCFSLYLRGKINNLRVWNNHSNSNNFKNLTTLEAT